MKLLLVFLFLLIFMIGIVLSKFEIEVRNIEFTFNDYYAKKPKISELDMEICLFWFSILKILSLKINKKEIRLNGIKLGIDLSKYQLEDKEGILKFFKSNREIIQYHLKRLNLNFKYSTSNSAITAILYPIISMVINNVISRYSLLRRDCFSITPYFYNVDSFKLSLNCGLNLSFIDLINLKKQIA